MSENLIKEAKDNLIAAHDNYHQDTNPSYELMAIFRTQASIAASLVSIAESLEKLGKIPGDR